MLPQNILKLEVLVDKGKYNPIKLKKEVDKIILDFIDEKKIKFMKKERDSISDSLFFSFIVDEEKINSGYLERNIGNIKGVKSVEVVDVKRVSG